MLLQALNNYTVIHQDQRFIIESEGLISYLRYYVHDETVDLFSAYVPESLRGNGYAASLILHALKYAVLNGLRVKPECAAVRAYLNLYPEWKYIVAQ